MSVDRIRVGVTVERVRRKSEKKKEKKKRSRQLFVPGRALQVLGLLGAGRPVAGGRLGDDAGAAGGQGGAGGEDKHDFVEGKREG